MKHSLGHGRRGPGHVRGSGQEEAIGSGAANFILCWQSSQGKCDACSP